MWHLFNPSCLCLEGISVSLRSHIWTTPSLVRADTMSALTLTRAAGCQFGPNWACNKQQVSGLMWSLWQWDVPGRRRTSSCLKLEPEKKKLLSQSKPDTKLSDARFSMWNTWMFSVVLPIVSVDDIVWELPLSWTVPELSCLLLPDAPTGGIMTVFCSAICVCCNGNCRWQQWWIGKTCRRAHAAVIREKSSERAFTEAWWLNRPRTNWRKTDSSLRGQL